MLCHLCLVQGKPSAPYRNLCPFPNSPGHTWAVDFITDLPDMNGYNMILVVIDRFSICFHGLGNPLTCLPWMTGPVAARKSERVPMSVCSRPYRQRIQADHHRHSHPKFQVGQQFWLSTQNLRLRLPCLKLRPCYIGPFRIINPVTYHLLLPCCTTSPPLSMCLSSSQYDLTTMTTPRTDSHHLRLKLMGPWPTRSTPS